MEKINLNKEIFHLIKDQKFDKLFDLIKTQDNIDFDVQDSNYNYFIHYLINYNQFELVKYVLQHGDIRLDVLDTDGRNLLYLPIKYNYLDLFKIILEHDRANIGISIIDIADNFGFTGLHYACIFSNIKAFKLLYENNADIYLTDKDNNNVYQIALQYQRNEIIIYLLNEEWNKNHNNIYFINTNGYSLLQNALTDENDEIIKYMLEKDPSTDYLNNQEIEFGLTALHQCVVLNQNDYAFKLIQLGANINISDFIGNSSFHYGLIENNYDYIQQILDTDNVNYNVTNLHGNTPLHLYLDNPIITESIFNSENRGKYQHDKMLLRMIDNTNLNIMNNKGITSLHLIIEKDLWKIKDIQNILTNGKKHMNLFISDNERMNGIDKLIYDKDKEALLDLTIESYYQILKRLKGSDKLILNWEKYCSNDDLDNFLKTLNKKKGRELASYCKEQIREMIVNKKRSIPQYQEIDLIVDNGIYKDGCFYTGSTIDIVFGLVYLYQEHKVGLILEYPIIENAELVEYYKKIGLNYTFKLDLSNIEIIWTFQKIIYPTNFNSILTNVIKKDQQFITIPIGIEIAEGSHANILIIDKTRKKIERFEPNGKNFPRGLYYNHSLLDELLVNKFSHLLPDYKYYKPSDYLPEIGLQMLETLEDEKCKKLGDPNGFCAVWCIWWAHMKIKNKKITSNILINELIARIKLDNKSFKDIVRNFSQKITSIRDLYLEKYNLTIDDWMINNYSADDLNKIESDILELIR